MYHVHDLHVHTCIMYMIYMYIHVHVDLETTQHNTMYMQVTHNKEQLTQELFLKKYDLPWARFKILYIHVQHAQMYVQVYTYIHVHLRLQ